MPENLSEKVLSRKLSDFCRVRLAPVLPPQEVEQLCSYMVGLIVERRYPPTRNRGLDWEEIAKQCGLPFHVLWEVRSTIQPGFDVVRRALKTAPPKSKASTADARKQQLADNGDRQAPSGSPNVVRAALASEADAPAERQKRGAKPKAIVEFPTPLFEVSDDPDSFKEALELQMRRHGDSYWHLYRAVVRSNEDPDHSTIFHWMRGTKVPRTVASFEMLVRIEKRYRLPEGYFRSKLPHQARSVVGHRLDDIGTAERRRLAWHLPDDFNARPRQEQEKILEWVRRVIISGSTDYRRFQAAAMKQRYAVRFPGITYGQSEVANDGHRSRHQESKEDGASFPDPDLMSGVIDAPPALAMEMAELIRFKTATLTAFGLQRNGVWGEETASQKIEHLGLMFGALAAHPRGPMRGYGVPSHHLTFGLLVFPSIWD